MKKRQPCASDSGVIPEPWPGTEQGVRQDRKKKMERTAPKTRPRLSEHHEQPKDKDPKPHNPQKWRTIEERWRLESQLATAAPRDSSTLRWNPRGNALAM